MAKEKKFITCDGNQAAAHISYMFSEVAAIYPITPSSTMAEYVDEWAAQGRKNIFGETVLVQEMQSEGGAAGAVHGSLQAGALTTTYTASQGLLLMIPNMYKIAGELLPCVFHVSARTLASHSLCIFGDHQDVMSCRQTGFAMLCEGSVQEVMDLAGVAHLSTIKSRVPFLNFFDGFRTSHEIQKIEMLENDDLAPLVDQEALKEFRSRALSPEHPVARGMAENPDTFFTHRESCNNYYDAVPAIVEDYMNKVSEITGRKYGLFSYYGAADAERVIIAMGSVTEAIRETIDHLTAQGEKVGLVAVHLYRPFSAKHFLAAVPATAKTIAVLDRTKEPGANGEPLYLDVKECFYGKENAPVIVGGRYGLGSNDTTPAQILAVYENLALPEPKNQFTLGIVDDVTFTSLPQKEEVAMGGEGMFEAKFYGLGADGTVGANKNSVKIIGDNTNKHCQAYFSYDSKKSGGLTISHLRFGDHPIRSAYYVGDADCVVCGNPSYVDKYDMVGDVKPGGVFLLNCSWSEEDLERRLPADMKRTLAQKGIHLYLCDAVTIAREIGLKGRINTIIQSAYFKLAGILPAEEAIEYMKQGIVNDYAAKGQKIVDMNVAAVLAGQTAAREVAVPEHWAHLEEEPRAAVGLTGANADQADYVQNILLPTNRMEGDSLPVSTFLPYATGKVPSGTSAFEKRGIAVEIPVWHPENCIQCNWCATVCPHAVIRPFLLKPEDAKGLDTVPSKTDPSRRFLIAVSAEDCVDCGSCAEMCPARVKALTMEKAEDRMHQDQMIFHYAKARGVQKGSDGSVRESQFLRPYLEYSGACPGCGETPYAKLVTQLFGDRAVIANATGCSSIWGASVPSMPYVVDETGKGPAWANSLFEDNAEFGYGMAISLRTRRAALKIVVERMAKNPAFAGIAKAWLAQMDTPEAGHLGQSLAALCKVYPEDADAKYVLEHADLLPSPSLWIFGGDGWAYDIGYGGLDHVLASRENFNVLVFDTEVYSNTGGQSSKATPTGAVAQFAAGGKPTDKKDLAQIAMTNGHVYVAQVAIGANPAQTLKALREAESYDGPSLIIAYAPCINHGLKAGMNRSMVEMKKAVRAGYWNLLRYDPRLAEAGKNPLQIDSAKPNEDYQAFLQGEVRYASLTMKNPDHAKALYEASEHNAVHRYESLLQRQASLEPKEGAAK